MERPEWVDYQGMDPLVYMEAMEDYADHQDNVVEALEDMVEEDMRLIHRSSKPVYLDGKVQDMNLGGDDEV